MDVRRDPGFEAEFDELFAIAERVARRVVGPAAAEDVAAEALSRAFARWPRVRDLPYRRAWVARVACNEALDVARRDRRRAPAAPRESAFETPDDVATRLALDAALARLPRRQRQVVALRYLADLDVADTARALGITVGAVKQHAHRALDAMRNTLGGDAALAFGSDHDG